ncbi:MAG: hypothetical protein ACE5JL_16040, partial [Dehalococcoidia bacterium]
MAAHIARTNTTRYVFRCSSTLSRHSQPLDPIVYAEDPDPGRQPDLGIASSSRVELHLNTYLTVLVAVKW